MYSMALVLDFGLDLYGLALACRLKDTLCLASNRDSTLRIKQSLESCLTFDASRER